jgi:hypothetical protein
LLRPRNGDEGPKDNSKHPLNQLPLLVVLSTKRAEVDHGAVRLLNLEGVSPAGVLLTSTARGFAVPAIEALAMSGVEIDLAFGEEFLRLSLAERTSPTQVVVVSDEMVAAPQEARHRPFPVQRPSGAQGDLVRHGKAQRCPRDHLPFDVTLDCLAGTRLRYRWPGHRGARLLGGQASSLR